MKDKRRGTPNIIKGILTERVKGVYVTELNNRVDSRFVTQKSALKVASEAESSPSHPRGTVKRNIGIRVRNEIIVILFLERAEQSSSNAVGAKVNGTPPKTVSVNPSRQLNRHKNIIARSEDPEKRKKRWVKSRR